METHTHTHTHTFNNDIILWEDVITQGFQICRFWYPFGKEEKEVTFFLSEKAMFLLRIGLPEIMQFISL